MYKRRYWVKFTSMWTHQVTIHSFDTYEEAEWYAKQVNGIILDWR